MIDIPIKNILNFVPVYVVYQVYAYCTNSIIVVKKNNKK